MGQDLGDTGAYGIFVPNSPEEGGDEPIPSLSPQHGGLVGTGIMGGGATNVDRQNALGALRQEWRTPPLWGVRDSAPYLHDGRADTLEQAIALHGGEAVRSAQRFFELKPEERMHVIAFLKSLRAPDTLVAAR
jgi:cytochrome c peroxidase